VTIRGIYGGMNKVFAEIDTLHRGLPGLVAASRAWTVTEA
jgi:hypothetical protein